MNRHLHNRREFLGLAGLGMTCIGRGFPVNDPVVSMDSTGAGPRQADLVVFNANVYTIDSRMPRAEAFAVKSGRFAFVGSTAGAKTFIAKETPTFDAKRMTIVPGFIDCHNHAPGKVLLYEVIVGNPYVVEFVTIASIIDKLRAKAQQTPPGTWIEGYF